ncbi:hypothetical protein N9B94_00545 [Verrucomicrobia bacterium]|nr:hypothetical protein [Verrucomicrobiota bacterium]
MNQSEPTDSIGISLSETELEGYQTIAKSSGIIDLSTRSRICVIGEDRTRFLHGQVTNDIKGLPTWSGSYAALVNGKGKFETDLHVIVLENELLLDFEPDLTEQIIKRLDTYVIADDVEMVDVAPHYGLFHIAGPLALKSVQGVFNNCFDNANDSTVLKTNFDEGEVYLYQHQRFGIPGVDVFAPDAQKEAIYSALCKACADSGGGKVQDTAFNAHRIESGVPRFGIDMDSSNLAPEAGITDRAISYAKGCYIGQEVIARIRTYGKVTKALRGLVLTGEGLPPSKSEIFNEDKKVGYLTSVLDSPKIGSAIALGYVRKECNDIGQSLVVKTPDSSWDATIVELPFEAPER